MADNTDKRARDDEDATNDTEGHYLQMAEYGRQVARERAQDFEREADETRKAKEVKPAKRRAFFRR